MNFSSLMTIEKHLKNSVATQKDSKVQWQLGNF